MPAKPVPDSYHTVTPYLVVIATHVEDVPPAELEKRAAEAARQRQG